MVQQRTNKTRCSTSRLLFIVLSCSVVTTLSNIFCCAVTAWTPPPADTHRRQYHPNNHQSSSNKSIRPLFSTVDELYYNPTTSASGTSTSGVFETASPLDDSTTSEEMEIAAQNYGCGTAGGNTGGSGSSQQKITLTRWLQAKVQDYPELRDMESLHLSIQMACKTISNLIHSSTTAKLSTTAAVSSSSTTTTSSSSSSSNTVAENAAATETSAELDSSSSSSNSDTTTTSTSSNNSETNNNNNLRDNSMKRLDQISKNVLQNALRFTGRLRVVEAPRGGIDSNGEEEGPAAHQPGVTIAYALDSYGKEGSGGGGGIGGGAGRKSRARKNSSSSSSSGGGSTSGGGSGALKEKRLAAYDGKEGSGGGGGIGGGAGRKSRARKNSTTSSSSSASSGGSSSGALKEKRLAAYADAKWGKTRRLAAFFDPLDGSGNADAAIPTGTVFGVFDADAAFPRGEIPDMKDTASLARAVLQPGNRLLAAGYCMYSSTTILVFTLGGGTHGFTLDPTINEFVLTHPNMKIPKRGNIYSCNEAYSEGWDDNMKEYLKTIKTGKGESGQRYTQRYIGSMVGDVHRTLTYGGIFCCPSDTEVHHNGNLQLVYKSAPMAYILEHAGGKSTNGENNLLSVKPERVHQRSPCFMGSPEDMDELMTYMNGEKGASQ
eukprot:CAMPEP_0201738668 /NCGR_PEP_ID=MMETSP0593-20130828/45375_1 /ASSEMBLY_ACC=CAM_ASM_000672 /TAXON_ID=267983 /ORGANISM="Skeletonema japonicum, Strain CCMP2506" /LENGTH=659 /DNA_ID=CAMNT_0048232895 /DNA_START=34 /DNA_END=2014 /DNA_ORIENTATION=-